MDGQANFEGWAVVEMFGYQREVGFVTTQAFGGAVLFRVDTPEMPEREYVLERPAYAHVAVPGEALNISKWAPQGSRVRRDGSPAKSVLVGPSAIYKLTPCTEATAMMAIERMFERPLMLLELAPGKQLGEGIDEEIMEDDE